MKGTIIEGQTLTKTFSVTAGERVRIALTWDSHTSGSMFDKTDTLTADLDLSVSYPGGSKSSLSFDNSYEFVSFTAPQSGTVTIRVTQPRFDRARVLRACMASLVSRRIGLLLASIVVAACAGELDGGRPATPKAPYTLAPPTPTLSPDRTVAPSGHAPPYDADAIFAVVSSSNNLPSELRTHALAEALAPRIWTYDGQPYRSFAVSGSCDDDGRRCDLLVEGLPGFAPDPDTMDHYQFTISVATGVLDGGGTQAGLKGFPPELVPVIDRAVRALLGDQIGDRSLLAMSWLLPPPEDGYLLRYGSGDEEGDQQLLVRYDRAANKVLSVTTE